MGPRIWADADTFGTGRACAGLPTVGRASNQSSGLEYQVDLFNLAAASREHRDINQPGHLVAK